MAIILTILKCLTVLTQGVQYSRSSKFLETYACLEETNITFVTSNVRENGDENRIKNLLSYLVSPCTKVSYYDHVSQETVQWNKEDEQTNIDRFMSLDFELFVEFIESLYHEYQIENDATRKQILIIDLVIRGIKVKTDDLYKVIGLLEKDTKWKVVLICEIYYKGCPFEINLPINRMVIKQGRKHEENYSDIRRQVKALIQNPDFNEFEHLKYIKMNKNKNLTCLANTTVHIVHGNLYVFQLLEKIALIKYNIPEFTNTKFIIYIPRFDKYNSVTIYLKENGLDNYNISIVNMNPYVWYFKTIQTNKKHVYFFESYLAIKENKMIFSQNLLNTHSSVILFFHYKTVSRSCKESFIRRTYFWYYKQKGFKKTVKKISFKTYDTVRDFKDGFIDVLLEASCF